MAADSVSSILAQRDMPGLEKLVKLFFAPSESSQAAGEAFRNSLCANMTETSCVTAISEQGGKENQHGNDERFCSARCRCDGSI